MIERPHPQPCHCDTCAYGAALDVAEMIFAGIDPDSAHAAAGIQLRLPSLPYPEELVL